MRVERYILTPGAAAQYQQQPSLLPDDIQENENDESYFLNAFPLIRRIAKAKLRGACREQVEDVVQKIGLNLWRWKTRRAEESEHSAAIRLSEEEWLKIANTATNREISSFYRSKYIAEETLTDNLLEHLARTDDAHQSMTDKMFSSSAAAVEGNSRAEVASLLNQVWKVIETFSLARKYAYLLGNKELLLNLITHETATRAEIARQLEMSEAEFNEVIRKLPVPDERIAGLMTGKTKKNIAVKQIWSWRAKAKVQLAERLRGKM